MRIIVPLVAVATLITTLTPDRANAAVIAHRPAITAFGGGVWTINPIAGGGNVGWNFRVTEPVFASFLGLVDQGADGLAESHPVGLFRETNASTGSGTLLASVTIGNDDALFGTTRYEQLGTPIALTPGVTYAVAAYFAPESPDNFHVSPSSVTRDTVIDYRGARFGSATSLGYPFSLNETNSGRYGPNFMFYVPEPSSLTSLLALLAFRRRRAVC